MEKLPMRIGELYRGKKILVTGFTGFIGKALVEKLLYSCSDIDKIYVLIRPKLGKSADQRLQETFSSDAFCRLKKERPGLFEAKVEAIEGDITQPLAGLSEEATDRLAADITIFYHVAADVKFVEPLAKAVYANTRSTRFMVEFALRMPQLKSFVYISTAFTNCNKKKIKEEIYPPHADWRKTIEICEKVDSETMSILSTKYIDTMPNTYVYSKQLAESIIKEYEDLLPMTVVRPSVVMNSKDEPFPGWFDTLFGPIGFVYGSLVGVIKNTLCRADNRTDLITVDYVVRISIIASALRMFTQKRDTIVFNCCSIRFGITQREFLDYCIQPIIMVEIRKRNLQYLKTRYYFQSKFWYTVDFIYRCILPAMIVDAVLKLVGQEPMLVKLRRKVYRYCFYLHYFAINEFDFDCNNILKSGDILHPDDYEAFHCQYHDVSIKEIFSKSYHYTFKYLDEKIITSKTIAWALIGLKYVDAFCQGATYLIVSYLLYWSRVPQNIISTLLDPSFYLLQ